MKKETHCLTLTAWKIWDHEINIKLMQTICIWTGLLSWHVQ